VMPDEVQRIVRTIDDTLAVFHARDLNSTQVCRLPEGTEFTLGHTSEIEGRRWIEALLPDGIRGYVLGPSALGHTTAGLTTATRARLDANGSAAQSNAITIEPVFTGLSLLTTCLVWAVIIFDLLHKAENWGGLLQFFLLFAVTLFGLLINVFLGAVAAHRGEYRAWPIALIGIALWILTILVVFLVRGNLFSG
jgi:hypothetical protein